MPQTLEAIAHAKAAKVPVIVAMNKIDKPAANTDRLMRELSGHGITPEEWGGESMFLPVSAVTKQGIPELLEAILLQADVLDLRAAPEGLASGFVIEAKLDKSRGPLATVLITQGTLKQHDWLVAGRTYGRVRAMFDDKGNRIKEALPAMPVEILGLSEVPAAGDTFNCVVNDSIAKEAVAFRIEKQRQKELVANQKSSLEEIMARLAVADSDKPKELSIILKADTHGSVEAIRSSLSKLDTEKVKTRVILGAVGGITETDITLGEASEALVVGFNVRPDRSASQVAESRGVDIKVFSIIYELLDTVQAAMVGKLAPVKTEKVQGHVEVRNLFSVPKIGVIAGSAVTDGKITRNSHVRVVRDGIVIYTGRIGSLKRFKEDAKEVLQGFECGVGIDGYNDLKVGDILESFIIEETAATL
jgi:translation initiation factor IF-2